ncbi:copper homeostasis protein CutC [Spongiimicrobium salis]|uniref:copper homeostasis protein CutC n=1 Tax=Spongiimicrobium salis TaxID=1667022 RepID=UPI00374D8D6C
MLVEVCANSLESALAAEKAGADRIELCSELGTGGITPSYGLLKAVKSHISIPVHVLIRPRSGNFTYSQMEFDIMKANIELCHEMGFEGVVSGVLYKDFRLDVERTKALIALAKPLKFTFHRAFDWVSDPLGTFQQLEALGVDYVLSSGQQKSALAGIDLLTTLTKDAKSCTVLPGGGVRADNANTFKNRGFKAIHFSGTTFKKSLERKPEISMNSPSFLQDDALAVTDAAIVRQIIEIVNN